MCDPVHMTPFTASGQPRDRRAQLVGAMLQDGTPVASGRRMAAFSNAEERAVELVDAMPFLLEDRLRELGGDVDTADD